MLTKYLNGALSKAKLEVIDDGQWYGEIPGFDGVWAHAPTEAECRAQLAEVLEEWVLFRVSRQLDLPAVNGINLVIRKAV